MAKKCPVCEHPKRKEIEALYEKRKMGAPFVLFARKMHEEFSVSKQSVVTHFKPIKQNKQKPHYVKPGFNTMVALGKEKREDADKLRLLIEEKGMALAHRVFEDYLEEEKELTFNQAISLLKAIGASQDSKRNIKIKEREISDKKQQFDSLFQAALYGAPVGKIRDAKIDDTKRDVQGVDSGAEEKLLEENTKGP